MQACETHKKLRRLRRLKKLTRLTEGKPIQKACPSGCVNSKHVVACRLGRELQDKGFMTCHPCWVGLRFSCPSVAMLKVTPPLCSVSNLVALLFSTVDLDRSINLISHCLPFLGVNRNSLPRKKYENNGGGFYYF